MIQANELTTSQNTLSNFDKLHLLDYQSSSKWEAFGISIVEAMARGNAIISTKTEGGKFLIQKENGFTYDFNNLEELKKSLTVLITNTKLREKMQLANNKKAQGFLWDNIAKQTEELYKMLLNA